MSIYPKLLITTITALLFSGITHAATLTVTVTDKDGKPAANSVVTAYSAAQPNAKPAPTQGVVIAQDKLQYSPLVTLLNVGSSAKFVNRDSFDHHIKTISGPTNIELRIDAAKRKDNNFIPNEHKQPIMFNEAGAVSLGCHLHGSMRGFVFVADTPWSGKTDAQGVLNLNDVPDGEIELRAWHPDQFIDQAPKKIKLSSAAANAAAMQLNVAVRVRRPPAASSTTTY